MANKKREVIPDYDAAMAELAEKKKKDRARYFERLNKALDKALTKALGGKYMTEFTPEEICEMLTSGMSTAEKQPETPAPAETHAEAAPETGELAAAKEEAEENQEQALEEKAPVEEEGDKQSSFFGF